MNMNLRFLYLSVFIFLLGTSSAQAAFEIEGRPTMGQWLRGEVGQPWEENPVGKDSSPSEGHPGVDIPNDSSLPDVVTDPSSEHNNGQQQVEDSAKGAGLGKDPVPAIVGEAGLATSAGAVDLVVDPKTDVLDAKQWVDDSLASFPPVEDPKPSSFNEGEIVAKNLGLLEPVENPKPEMINEGELVEQNLGLLEPVSEPKPRVLSEAELVEESLGILNPVESPKPTGINEKQIVEENVDFSSLNGQSSASVLDPAFASGMANPLPAASILNSLPAAQNAGSAVSVGSVLPRTDGFVPSLP